jgi:hypothetical protein
MRVVRVLVVLGSLAAVAAMAFGQYRIRLDLHDAQATWFFLAAAAAAALLLAWRGEPPPPSWEPAVPRRRFVRLLAVLAIGVAASAIGTASYLLADNWSLWFVYGGLLMLAGIALLSLGLSAFDPPRRRLPWSRAEVIALLLILLLGLFLRFHRFGEFPGPFTVHAVEEPQTGAGGHKILNGVRPWEFLGDHYLAALGIYLTGDPSIQSIRAPFALFSALTIIPLHLVLRQLVSTPAALAGTFLFAVSSWNIIYSRCAHNIFLTNFVVVANLALLLQFARSGRLALLPWIGLLSGYTLYTYAGYRGTIVLTLAFLGLLLLRLGWQYLRLEAGSSRGRAGRAVWRNVVAILLVVGMTGALVAPIIVITTANRAQPDYYFEAAMRSLSNRQYYTDDRSVFLQQRLRRITETARIFMHRGDGSDTFNYPGEPMVDPVTAVCFVGGLFIAVFFPWRRYNGYFLFVFLFLLAGAAVFVQNLDVRRLQGITPLVAIFAALFLDHLWKLARPAPRSVRLAAAVLVCSVAGTFTLWWNYDVYFNKMAGDRRVRQAFTNHYMSLVQYGRTAGSDRELLLLTYIKSFFYPSDYYWLVDGVIHGRVLDDLTAILPPAELPGGERPQTVVIQEWYERAATAALLTELYPSVQCRDFVEADNPHVSLTACDLPPNPEPRQLTSTLQATYWVGPLGASEPVLTRQEPFIGYSLVPRVCHYRLPPESSEICSAEWVGTLEVEEGLTLDVGSRAGAVAEVFVDGARVAAMPVPLRAGKHEIIVRAHWPRNGEAGVRLERRTAAGAEPVLFYRVEPEASAASEDEHEA